MDFHDIQNAGKTTSDTRGTYFSQDHLLLNGAIIVYILKCIFFSLSNSRQFRNTLEHHTNSQRKELSESILFLELLKYILLFLIHLCSSLSSSQLESGIRLLSFSLLLLRLEFANI